MSPADHREDSGKVYPKYRNLLQNFGQPCLGGPQTKSGFRTVSSSRNDHERAHPAATLRPARVIGGCIIGSASRVVQEVKMRCALTVTILASIVFCPAGLSRAEDSLETRVWSQFVSALKEGRLTEENIKPYEELRQLNPASVMLKFLAVMKQKAVWEEWDQVPEIHRLGDTVHFLIPLTFDGRRNTFCFSFLLQGDHWYFRHVESITIRLDKIGELPASTFPDVSESKKAWMREERRVQAQVDLFNLLSKEKSKDYAFNWFRDGFGYFLEAKTWVPFLPPRRAFILYLCWEQSSLQGNNVTLEKLEDDEALVRIEPIYLRLFEQTSIQQKVGFDDYRRMFEIVWLDRACAANWDLNIEYHETQCIFRFKGR